MLYLVKNRPVAKKLKRNRRNGCFPVEESEYMPENGCFYGQIDDISHESDDKIYERIMKMNQNHNL